MQSRKKIISSTSGVCIMVVRVYILFLEPFACITWLVCLRYSIPSNRGTKLCSQEIILPEVLQVPRIYPSIHSYILSSAGLTSIASTA